MEFSLYLFIKLDQKSNNLIYYLLMFTSICFNSLLTWAFGVVMLGRGIDFRTGKLFTGVVDAWWRTHWNAICHFRILKCLKVCWLGRRWSYYRHRRMLPFILSELLISSILVQIIVVSIKMLCLFRNDSIQLGTRMTIDFRSKFWIDSQVNNNNCNVIDHALLILPSSCGLLH